MPRVCDSITGCIDPAHFGAAWYDEAERLTRTELEAIQLGCIRKRFAQLRESVAVLGNLAHETSTDLSHLPLAGVETIDDWIDELDRHTPLEVLHTFGTSGKLSFIPRTARELQLTARVVANCVRDWHGRESSADDDDIENGSAHHAHELSLRSHDLVVQSA